MKESEPCPVCKSVSEIQGANVAGTILYRVSCFRCGEYQIEYVAKSYLNIQLDATKMAILSHAIRKMQKNNEFPTLDQKTVALILQRPLPKPTDQINSFMLWLGDNTLGLGEKVDIDGLVLQAEIGARTQEGIDVIINYLVDKDYIEQSRIISTDDEPRQFRLALKLPGWEYYESLKHGSISSRKAFMAMKYGDQELDEIVANCLRPAIKATGFDLYRLDDVPRAGLIDDRLRVEIRTSRFLIADLTHENAGAYWEAGFAEGLGKPVIYTCEKSKFEAQKTHFDTNHHTTVLWDKNDLKKTASELKSTIRETLSEEAKLTDE